jgi:cytoskeleton protein RodZ
VDSRAPVGARLRRGRLDRGLSLADLGEALHVPARYIHAIETDDYAALPPTVYTRALIREYARYLGINPAEVLERSVPMRPTDRNPIRPALQPIERSTFTVSWKALAVAGGVIVCIGLFAYLYSQYNSFAQSIDAGRGSQTVDLLPTPVTRVAAIRITPFAASTDTPIPLPPTATPIAGIVVEARLTEPSWVQVWTDGRQNPGEVLPAGTTRTFTADQSIRMRVGNAGGIDVTVNGANQGKLGAQNQAMEATWGRE